jgi:cell wall assembly regulator SMI1
MRFTESGPPLTEERLQGAERRLGVTLPDEYRAFLLRHNGGRPHPSTLSIL